MIRILLLSLLLPLASSAAPPASERIDAATARLELARLLRDDSRFDEAIVQYQTLLEADPADFAVAGELAQTLVWAKRYDAAKAVLKSIPPADYNPAAIDAAATLDIQAGRMGDAVTRLRELLKLKDTPAIRLQLAEVLSFLKQYDESLSLYSALVAENPDDIQLRRQYARVLGWAGRNAEAVHQWEISLAPTR